MVKLLYRFNQTHVTFLNQIKEQHSASYITFGNTYNETKVRFSQTALRFFIPVFDPFCELHLVIS
ncbi:hypothetical protein D3C74_451300 [compost metagenome]